MEIIYGKELREEEYIKALHLFLKWTSLFNEHIYGGFLKPIYRTFCQWIYGLSLNEY